MHQAPLFRPLDVRLAASDMLRSTPTTLSVLFQQSNWVGVIFSPPPAVNNKVCKRFYYVKIQKYWKVVH